jgi:hypothetical protein
MSSYRGRSPLNQPSIGAYLSLTQVGTQAGPAVAAQRNTAEAND